MFRCFGFKSLLRIFNSCWNSYSQMINIRKVIWRWEETDCFPKTCYYCYYCDYYYHSESLFLQCKGRKRSQEKSGSLLWELLAKCWHLKTHVYNTIQVFRWPEMWVGKTSCNWISPLIHTVLSQLIIRRTCNNLSNFVNLK